MDRNSQIHLSRCGLSRSGQARGFTLIEMIVVIVLTSILASAVAVFIKLPIQGYVDMARRAELTDEADTALRRMGRDLRLALPNSLRITDGGTTLELLLTRTGGRYRTTVDSSAAGDLLDFSVNNDPSFDQLGPLASGVGQTIIAGDKLIVYNLGIPGANAYDGDNLATISNPPTSVGTLANENKINFTFSLPTQKFPFESPGNRFQVIEGPVSYVCDAATGLLTRYWDYAIAPTQPNAATLAASAAQRALAASNVGPTCTFEYSPGVTERAGLVTLTLELTRSGETVRLYHEVHVTNVP